MMRFCFFLLLFFTGFSLSAQRKEPVKSREQKQAEKEIKKRGGETPPVEELRWDPRPIRSRSRGLPEISAWHTGTAGIIAPDAAELSLFNQSRIGFSRNTELLLRIGEEPFLPNIGFKHRWGENRRFTFSSEHSLYWTFPLLKIWQHTGYKKLIPDSVDVAKGFVMRNEAMLSWLLNPQIAGCPDPPAEKILTFRAGLQFYFDWDGIKSGVPPFDYLHSLYHSQVFAGNLLYYGGLQFDSYFSDRFHYSLNAFYYNVDISRDFAVEGNARLTCFVSRKVGISASCKVAYMDIGQKLGIRFLPLLDIAYLINPGRSAIKHGLFKNKRKLR